MASCTTGGALTTAEGLLSNGGNLSNVANILSNARK